MKFASPAALIGFRRAKNANQARWLLLCLLAAGPFCADSQVSNSPPRQLAREDFLKIEKKWGETPLEAVQKAANEGQPDAMYELYVRLRDGTGIMPDDQQAKVWLAKAAEEGNAQAQCFLGYYYEHSIAYSKDDRANWRTNNMAEAIRWYRRSADQNHPGGQFRLGLCYLEGEGVYKDEERGLELLRKAADQGHSYSLHKLAELYARGIGEPRNEQDRPVELLRRAATYNFKNAFSALFFRYQHGIGTDRNLILASEWYCWAAIANTHMYPLKDKISEPASGQAPKTDPFALALNLFFKAVKRRDSDAALRIGEMYAIGREVPRNPEQAWQWFNLAAQRGSNEAANDRSAMEKRMTPDELAGAKQRADAFEKELATISEKLPRDDK